LSAALARYGASEQILTDKGKVFTGRFSKCLATYRGKKADETSMRIRNPNGGLRWHLD
jgi:hypothetical protein